jgi:hypothetical protein
LKQKNTPDARHENEMRELLKSTREFFTAKLEKSLSDTENAVKVGAGIWFCCFKGALKGLTQARVEGMREIASQMSYNEQNPEMVIANVQTTANMWTLDELQNMLERARLVQKSGDFNLAAQLDNEEFARSNLGIPPV